MPMRILISGLPEVGELLAEQLGIPYVDADLVPPNVHRPQLHEDPMLRLAFAAGAAYAGTSLVIGTSERGEYLERYAEAIGAILVDAETVAGDTTEEMVASIRARLPSAT